MDLDSGLVSLAAGEDEVGGDETGVSATPGAAFPTDNDLEDDGQDGEDFLNTVHVGSTSVSSSGVAVPEPPSPHAQNDVVVIPTAIPPHLVPVAIDSPVTSNREKSTPTQLPTQLPPPHLTSLLPPGFELPPGFTFSAGLRDSDTPTAPTATKKMKIAVKKGRKKGGAAKSKSTVAPNAARKKGKAAEEKAAEEAMDEDAGANARPVTSATDAPGASEHTRHTSGTSIQEERGQRTRKPAASKEVVSLTDKRRALEALG